MKTKLKIEIKTIEMLSEKSNKPISMGRKVHLTINTQRSKSPERVTKEIAEKLSMNFFSFQDHYPSC